MRVSVVVDPLAGTEIEVKLVCSLTRAGSVVEPLGAEMVHPSDTLSEELFVRFQEYGIVGEQVAVLPVRVACTVSDSIISLNEVVPSSTRAVAVH